MATKPTDKKSAPSKSAAGATAKDKAVSSVVSNPRLVAAIKQYTQSLEQSQTYLVEVGEIIQNEQLTRPEVVASLMEARGIEKSTAESQYSRMKAIFTNPEVLEQVRSGEMDLKTARASTKKAQANPSAEAKSKALDKRLATCVSGLVSYAKESGTDVVTILNTVKAAMKKNGVK